MSLVEATEGLSRLGKGVKREKEQKIKRCEGVIKKTAQVGMLADLRAAIFIHNLVTNRYFTYESAHDDAWALCYEYIKQVSPKSTHLHPSDFELVEKEPTKHKVSRRHLPDIKRRRPVRRNKRTTNAQRTLSATPPSPSLQNATTRESESRLPHITPPPPLPRVLTELAQLCPRLPHPQRPPLTPTRWEVEAVA